jgi:hypothetical protein
VRYRLREIGPEAYDSAARLRPETCPMHYMGDRRTGGQLLRDAPADAALIPPPSNPSRPPGGTEHALRPGPCGGSGPEVAWAGGGYGRACGGRGLLYGMAAAVERLTGVVGSAGPEGLCVDSWARAVRDLCKFP